MSNTLLIEGQLMHDYIKDIDDPKEALEKLATLDCQMGWDIHPERVRAIAYASWLKEKGMDDWYDYFEKMIQFHAQIASGATINIESLGEVPDAPEGWIPPLDYLKAKLKELAA